VVKLGKTRQQDRSAATKYQAVGRALHRTAMDLKALGARKYGNGLAIVAIHAAIAYTDALTIAYRGIRSTDGDHRRAVDVLQHALGHRADPEQVRRLRGILDAKTHASYSGTYYTLDDAESILRDTDLYVTWAEELLARRPFAG
jgi:hypothetical protein